MASNVVDYQASTLATHDRLGRLIESTRGMVPPDRLLMAWNLLSRSYTLVAYNPTTVRDTLRRADQGFFGEALEMYDVMASSDPETTSVIMKRQLTGRKAKRSIVPADDSPTAATVAEYVTEVLENMVGWDDAIADLMPGNYNGFSALEIEWSSQYPIALYPTLNEDWRWQNGARVLSQEHAEYIGLLWRGSDYAWAPVPADKFVINSPNARLPVSRRGQFRAISGTWSTKQVLQVVLDSFCELYGTPRTVIKVPDEWSADSDKMEQLVENMAALGAEGYALLSDLISVENLSQQSSSDVPQIQALERKDRQIAKAILGGTLTTDTAGSTGTYSAASVHLDVERDVAESDLENVAEALNRDLVEPMVRYAFGPTADPPTLVLTLSNPEREAAELDHLTKAVAVGIPVATSYAHEVTGIPEPDEGESVLTHAGSDSGETVNDA
jgi:phage gp29-like protein